MFSLFEIYRFQHDTSISESNLCCTICNTLSDENAASSASASSSSSSSAYQKSLALVKEPVQDNTDIWLCLICGFTGCGSYRRNHIFNHFQETSHTYALNTLNQSVWDFAGDGYVHRLALESNVGSSSDGISSGGIPKMKVTEVDGYSEPRSPAISSPFSPGSTTNTLHGVRSSGYRSQIAPLSDRQERELLSSKQDQILSHYNQILQWRLRENSLFYESKIKQIWDSVDQTKSGSQQNKQQGLHGKKASVEDVITGGPHGGVGAEEDTMINYLQSPLPKVEVSKSLIDNIKHSLQTEKRKLLKQCELMKEKIQQAEKENDIGKSLHAALTKNLNLMHNKVKEREDQYRQMEMNLS